MKASSTESYNGLDAIDPLLDSISYYCAAMRLLTLSALALAAETAYGYLDTSPFFMFSTSEYEL